jgi:hypothetical protein
MRKEERLVGYDAREMLASPSAWTQHRIDTFLLRTRVDKALSVDTMVWPSVFAAEENVDSPPWARQLKLWHDLQRLEDRLEDDSRPFWIITIALLWSPLNAQERDVWEAMLSTTPRLNRSGEWRLLGYDIADRALTSGLSNCGYDPQEVQALRVKWTPHLNGFHLFIDSDRAYEFKMMTDSRVREHAPFFVYGLYRVRADELATAGARSDAEPA